MGTPQAEAEALVRTLVNRCVAGPLLGLALAGLAFAETLYCWTSSEPEPPLKQATAPVFQVPISLN